jgi:hypothetical protein
MCYRAFGRNPEVDRCGSHDFMCLIDHLLACSIACVHAVRLSSITRVGRLYENPDCNDYNATLMTIYKLMVMIDEEWPVSGPQNKHVTHDPYSIDCRYSDRPKKIIQCRSGAA